LGAPAQRCSYQADRLNSAPQKAAAVSDFVSSGWNPSLQIE
jgi:hypothetical protein